MWAVSWDNKYIIIIITDCKTLLLTGGVVFSCYKLTRSGSNGHISRSVWHKTLGTGPTRHIWQLTIDTATNLGHRTLTNTQDKEQFILLQQEQAPWLISDHDLMSNLNTSTILHPPRLRAEYLRRIPRLWTECFCPPRLRAEYSSSSWEIWDFACLWQEDWMLGERLVRLWELRRRKYVFSSGIYNSTTALFAFHTYIISIFLPQLNQTPF